MPFFRRIPKGNAEGEAAQADLYRFLVNRTSDAIATLRTFLLLRQP